MAWPLDDHFPQQTDGAIHFHDYFRECTTDTDHVQRVNSQARQPKLPN